MNFVLLRTSSTSDPKSNGMAEKYVQTAKRDDRDSNLAYKIQV